MVRKHTRTEEIIRKSHEADVLIGQDQTVSDFTYCCWRKEYGGLKMDGVKRFKELEKENARLKRLLADAELDKSNLREAAS